MNRLAHASLYVLTFAAGAAAGAYLDFKLHETTSQVSEIAEAAYYATYLETQRREANDAAYEEALRSYLALLERRKQNPTPLYEQHVYNFDMAIGYARLASLAMKRNAEEEAEQYLAKAMAFCPQLGWKDCSRSTIIGIAQRLDKRAMFGSRPTQ